MQWLMEPRTLQTLMDGRLPEKRGLRYLRLVPPRTAFLLDTHQQTVRKLRSWFTLLTAAAWVRRQWRRPCLRNTGYCRIIHVAFACHPLFVVVPDLVVACRGCYSKAPQGPYAASGAEPS